MHRTGYKLDMHLIIIVMPFYDLIILPSLSKEENAMIADKNFVYNAPTLMEKIQYLSVYNGASDSGTLCLRVV